jgi:hypothetical protein
MKMKQKEEKNAMVASMKRVMEANDDAKRQLKFVKNKFDQWKNDD